MAKTTDDWQSTFLYVLAETGSITAAIRACKVRIDTLYRLRATSPRFEHQVQNALADARDLVIEILWERVQEGDEQALLLLAEWLLRQSSPNT